MNDAEIEHITRLNIAVCETLGWKYKGTDAAGPWGVNPCGLVGSLPPLTRDFMHDTIRTLTPDELYDFYEHHLQKFVNGSAQNLQKFLLPAPKLAEAFLELRRATKT